MKFSLRQEFNGGFASVIPNNAIIESDIIIIG